MKGGIMELPMDKLSEKINEVKKRKTQFIVLQEYEKAIKMRGLERKYEDQRKIRDNRINTISKLLDDLSRVPLMKLKN